jgi:hypothetical protein
MNAGNTVREIIPERSRHGPFGRMVFEYFSRIDLGEQPGR